MSTPRAVVAVLAVLAAVAIGCGGDDGDGGSQRGETITVWTYESQPDRLDTTKGIFADFTKKTGIKTKLVPIPEGQGPTLITNAAAAGDLPDVVLASSNADSVAYAAQGVYDANAAQEVVDRLGPDTFSPGVLDLVDRDGKATGVPSDGWGMLLIYRSDLFKKAGLDPPETTEDILTAAKQLDGPDMDGIALFTKSGDEGTAQVIEDIGLAYGCQLVDDSGNVTFNSPECVDALRYYGDLANYSASGAQDFDSTRATYFAGRAATMFWSPFLLDGMAGLRNDTRPSCPQCRDNPAFLAENSGLVGPIKGPGGGPTQFGIISTSNITEGANTAAAQKLVEYMMTDGYVRWLGLSPQGKYPVRPGKNDEYIEAWKDLDSGVERRAPLSKFYSKESLASLGEGAENFTRWAFPQGQGALLGALSGDQPIADAGAEVISGKDPKQVAEDTQAAVEEIQAGLE